MTENKEYIGKTKQTNNKTSKKCPMHKTPKPAALAYKASILCKPLPLNFCSFSLPGPPPLSEVLFSISKLARFLFLVCFCSESCSGPQNPRNPRRFPPHSNPLFTQIGFLGLCWVVHRFLKQFLTLLILLLFPPHFYLVWGSFQFQ